MGRGLIIVINHQINRYVRTYLPMGKIAERSVFLTTWHCILSAELKGTPPDCCFDDFAHWAWSNKILQNIRNYITIYFLTDLLASHTRSGDLTADYIFQ